MSSQVRILDCDYEKALEHKWCIDGKEAWRKIRDIAQREAAARMVKVNLDKQKRLALEAEGMETKTMAGRVAWLAKHDEITRVGKEFDELMTIAYPKSEGA